MNSTRWWLVLVIVASCASGREITEVPIRPSLTDPAIKSFDSPHVIYVDREIVVDHRKEQPADRHQLLLWLAGTGGKATDCSAFCSLAASLGYHVISLMYPNEVPAAVCRVDSDPHAFEDFRMAVLQGGSMRYISIATPDSVEYRLLALLRLLRERRPKEDWGQFLTAEGSIRWSALAVAGFSQGGGHAILLGIKHPVARVIGFGAPKDFNRRLNAPAAWYGEVSATPKERFFVFNHDRDPRGCTPAELIQNIRALGLTALGAAVDVTKEPFPFRASHDLLSSYPNIAVGGEESDSAGIVHASVIANINAERWKRVWTYLLVSDF